MSELLDGESLRARIADGPVPARKALDHAVQIAHGLAAAHDRGIVHRDLEPDNIFVGTDGRVKILDFGLAKLTQAESVLAGASALPTAGLPPPQTMPGMVLGTLGYMAPEQVRGMAADHRANIFALGVVLYEMLAGRRGVHRRDDGRRDICHPAGGSARDRSSAARGARARAHHRALPGEGFLRNMSWTPDGRQLVYTRQETGGHDIWLLTIDDPSPSAPLLDNPWSEHSPRVSPDGRCLAYVSDESGRPEVWVQRFPRGERRRVSENGGQGPVWSRERRQLYFQGPHDGAPRLMTVAVESAGEELRLGAPAPLLEMRVAGPTGVVEQYGLSNNVGPMFDVLPGGRFVMVRGADPLGTREIVLVQQFGEEARRLVTAR